MDKEVILKSLDEIKELVNDDKKFKYKNIVNFNCKRIEEELEVIDNTNYGEALECLECIYCEPEDYRSKDRAKDYEIIKQALLKAREQEKENELLREIIKSFFDRGCPLHQYIDKVGILQIEVDDECSTMHLGKFKDIDLDKKLKEVLEWQDLNR